MEPKFYLGIDVGSTTFKAVILTDDKKVHNSIYQRTKAISTGRLTCTGKCHHCGACNLGAMRKKIDKFLANSGLTFDKIACTVVTGSQVVEDTKRFIPYNYKVSEVSAHVAGARHYYPECDAVLDVGGQDSKAMLYNSKMHMWNSKMSGICAAGTGAFLDSVALKLNVPVEEMEKQINYDSKLEFSSVCAVLSATSINKFKNRFPIGDIIGGACRAQARTIINSVGKIFNGYKGGIVFQGGVAYNQAVAYYLREITGNDIVIPKFRGVMGALGAALLALKYAELHNKLEEQNNIFIKKSLKSITLRARSTINNFLAQDSRPLVWRNLFFPAEILNAMNLRILTLETYAALFARSPKKIKNLLDSAASKGYSAETCSFLRVLEGVKLPEPCYCVATSEPCQQGERVFQDIARTYGIEENFFSLYTSSKLTDNAIDHMAGELEQVISNIEKTSGRKLDMGRLGKACELSNQARKLSIQCNKLRFSSLPLIRGTKAVYFSTIFSQAWGSRELIDIQQQFLDDLQERKEKVEKSFLLRDTHRIIWLHLPPFYNRELLDYIEINCNAPIVFEEVNYTGWDPLIPDDPLRSLARKLLQSGFLNPQDRVKTIGKVVTQANLNGCILYNHGFGRCSMSDASFIKHLREELNRNGVPLLVLDGDCLDPTIDPCSTYTKVSAYIEALNDRKFGNIFGPLRA
jgi:predicted CoA-substrate-specific enzyme activase